MMMEQKQNIKKVQNYIGMIVIIQVVFMDQENGIIVKDHIMKT